VPLDPEGWIVGPHGLTERRVDDALPETRRQM
jgi:hypothetical protein